jgi:hypothetical protein
VCFQQSDLVQREVKPEEAQVRRRMAPATLLLRHTHKPLPTVVFVWCWRLDIFLCLACGVQAYAKNDLGVDYFETSAKDGVNVEEAFLRLAEQMKKRFVAAYWFACLPACLRSSEVCRFACLPFPANLAATHQSRLTCVSPPLGLAHTF